MYSSVKKMVVVMAALFVSSLAAQEASAAISVTLYKKNETATKVDVKLKATASHPGLGSVTFESPWYTVRKFQPPVIFSKTILAFRFSCSLQWSGNKIVARATASVTVLGQTLTMSKTESLALSSN
jgi:hypothetical protein